MIDQNTNNNIWSIRKQAVEYSMFLKRKQRAKVKAKGCIEGCYHQMFNHKVELSSHLVPSRSHMGSCVMNTMDYNYKLRSVNGQENNFTANKWT